jgi:Raf kinase inhibitor-like YbhB/YbcL family protein
MLARYLLAAAGTVLMLGSAAPSARAAGVFTLQSKTFQDGHVMPKRVANENPKNPNCVGQNVSPEFHWSNVPAGTKSFVLLMSDPEARGGALLSHWVAYGIPATVTGLPEGAAGKDSDLYVGGKSFFGVGHYVGPCTPPGVSPHHYTFILIATDFEPKELPPGLTRAEVQEKLAPPGQQPTHTKADSGMVGLFVNPWRPTE